MKAKYEPGWTVPHHGNYCDHYATAIGDPNTCGRCGATRLTPLRASPAVRSDPHPQLPLGGGPVERTAGVREHVTRTRTAGE